MLKEDLYTYVNGFAIMNNNFIYHLTNNVLKHLVSAGIPEFLFNYMISSTINTHKIRHNLNPTAETAVISFNDLSYGFTLWILACLFCYVAFLLELTTFYLKMDPVYHFKNLIGLLGILYVLTVYNKCYYGDLSVCMGHKKSRSGMHQKRYAWNSKDNTVELTAPEIIRNEKYMTWIAKIIYGKC
jgi:hypothetical protein